MIFEIFAALWRLIAVTSLVMLSGVASGSDYGTTGLIDIPTARFEEDGLFSVGASTD